MRPRIHPASPLPPQQIDAADSRTEPVALGRGACGGSGGEFSMWEQPRAISIVAGNGEGRTELTAFDRALMDAGIANLNFLRVTSILPADVAVIPIPTF